MDRGAWWATVHGVAKSQTRQHLRVHARAHTQYGCLKGNFNFPLKIVFPKRKEHFLKQSKR